MKFVNSWLGPEGEAGRPRLINTCRLRSRAERCLPPHSRRQGRSIAGIGPPCRRGRGCRNAPEPRENRDVPTDQVDSLKPRFARRRNGSRSSLPRERCHASTCNSATFLVVARWAALYKRETDYDVSINTLCHHTASVRAWAEWRRGGPRPHATGGRISDA